MKAIRVHEFGGPEVLQLREVDTPTPAADEVLVRVKAAGVNPYETYMRAGMYGAKNPTLPFTPGSDAAGIVEAVGSAVADLGAGTRVFTTGTATGSYAELTLCKRNQVHHLPDRVTFAQGAGVYVPYATAYRALFQLARSKPGEAVLVHGASGGVGVATTQTARAAGMTVYGTAGSEDGLDLVRAQGATRAFNHRSPDYRDEIMRATAGRGVDVIVEMLANVNLGHDLRLLADFGRVVIVGSRGDVQITPRDIMTREAEIHAVLLWHTPPEDAAEIYAAVGAGLESGTLNPVVGTELPLAQAAEAHRQIMEPGAAGKIVLVP